jgi:hypothetical protein
LALSQVRFKHAFVRFVKIKRCGCWGYHTTEAYFFFILIAGGTCLLFGFASAKKGFLFVEAKIFVSFCTGK